MDVPNVSASYHITKYKVNSQLKYRGGGNDFASLFPKVTVHVINHNLQKVVFFPMVDFSV